MEEPTQEVKTEVQEPAASSSCLVLSQCLMVLFGIVAIGLTIAIMLPVIKLQPWSSPALAMHLVKHQFLRVIDSNEQFGQSALEAAIYEGDVESVTILSTKRGIDMDYLRDEAALTPLIKVVDSGNLEMLDAVLGKFANVEAEDMLGYTALQWAAARPSVEAVKKLLAAGANPNTRGTIIDIAPMHLAASGGSVEVLEMLAEKGAEIEPTTTDGLTPIWRAAARGAGDAVNWFLERNAATDRIDHNGNSLLHLASAAGNPAVAAAIHKTAGAKDFITKRNHNGDTPFHLAVRGGAIEVASYLAEHGGANFDKGSADIDLVEFAVSRNAPELLSFLIGIGADIKTNLAHLQEIAARFDEKDVSELLATSSFVGGAGLKL